CWLFAHLPSRDERTYFLGLAAMCFGFGFIFRPGVGGLLAGISLSLAYYVTAVVITSALIFSFLKVKETYQQSTKETPKTITLTTDYFMQPIGILMIGTFFVMFFMSGMESTFQLLGQDRINITPTEMGALFFIGGIFNALTQGVYIRKLKDGQEKKAMVAGQIMAVIAFIMLPFMNSLIYAGVCIVLLM